MWQEEVLEIIFEYGGIVEGKEPCSYLSVSPAPGMELDRLGEERHWELSRVESGLLTLLFHRASWGDLAWAS